jgi:hypothetical protein
LVQYVVTAVVLVWLMNMWGSPRRSFTTDTYVSPSFLLHGQWYEWGTDEHRSNSFDSDPLISTITIQQKHANT